ncbi:MAG: gliding motility-associated C-terminal domain-containing protein [Bacteroidota bacterium]
MKLNRSEQIIKDKLLDYKPEVDHKLWSRLEDKLNAAPLKVRKFSFAKYAIPAAASILFAVVSFAAFQIIRYQKNEKPNISNSNPIPEKATFSFVTYHTAYDSLNKTPLVLIQSIPLSSPSNEIIINPYNYNYFTALQPKKISPTNSISRNENNISEHNQNIAYANKPFNNLHPYAPNAFIQPQNSIVNNATKLQPNLPNQNNINKVIPVDSGKVNVINNHQVQQLNPVNEVVVNDKDNTEKFNDTNVQTEVDTPAFEIGIPNVFTPNNDGINDLFVIKNLENCQSNHLRIFNKEGKLVYDKSQYQNNWDAKQLPSEVYFYQLKYVIEGKEFVKHGSITVLR